MSAPIIDYSDASWPVRGDFAATHSRFWQRLARPGTWWTGEERVAIAAETRAAKSCGLCAGRRNALSPAHVDGVHDRVSELPEAAVDVVHRLVTDAGRLTAAWYQEILDSGLGDGAYVEIVGTVVAMVSIDSFALALGLEPRPLPAPEAGEPSRYRPASATMEDAWVPLVPEDNSETPEADLWPAKRTGYVIRAMSLVPEEVRTLNDLSAAHYLPNHLVRDPTASQGSLSRPQVELIAGRVSALNECFY